jgi:hypothetical protein
MRLMLTIYIDADACPVKDEVYRVALVAYAGQDLTSVEQLVKLFWPPSLGDVAAQPRTPSRTANRLATSTPERNAPSMYPANA